MPTDYTVELDSTSCTRCIVACRHMGSNTMSNSKQLIKSSTKVSRNTSAKTTVKAPVAQNRSSQRVKPGTYRIRETERIGTINGSTTFNCGGFEVNPGLATAFPWLQQIANVFDEYKFHKLKFRYKNFVGTQLNGNVIMAFDYDVLDPTPTTAIQMTQMSCWKDGAPWRIFELPIDVNRINKKFTRDQAITGSDQKTYDAGKLFIATEGFANTDPAGYLEVEYDVEFFNKSPVGLNH